MTNETRQNSSNNFAPVWGIVLLFIGIVFLLQTLNVLPWNLWETLWRFWPAIIIIIGICILMRRTNIWLISLLTVIILGGCLGIAIYQHGTGETTSGKTTATYTQPLDNIQQADINIDFAAGSMDIANLPADSTALIKAETETKDDTSSMNAEFSKQQTGAQLDLSTINQQFWPGKGITWDLKFSPGVPLTFNINASASTVNLDLKDLEIAGIDIEVNAGNVDLSLPDPGGTIPVTVKANAAHVVIDLPDGAAARIQGSANVGSLDIDSRFTKEGNDYFTQNYDRSTNRFELEVESNVGSIEIN